MLKRAAMGCFVVYFVVALSWFGAHFPTQFYSQRFTVAGVTDVPCCWTALWCSQDHPGRFAPADFARFTCRGSTFVGARGEPFERDRFDDCAGLRAAVAMASNATL